MQSPSKSVIRSGLRTLSTIRIRWVFSGPCSWVPTPFSSIFVLRCFKKSDYVMVWRHFYGKCSFPSKGRCWELTKSMSPRDHWLNQFADLVTLPNEILKQGGGVEGLWERKVFCIAHVSGSVPEGCWETCHSIVNTLFRWQNCSLWQALRKQHSTEYPLVAVSGVGREEGRDENKVRHRIRQMHLGCQLSL